MQGYIRPEMDTCSCAFAVGIKTPSTTLRSVGRFSQLQNIYCAVITLLLFTESDAFKGEVLFKSVSKPLAEIRHFIE